MSSSCASYICRSGRKRSPSFLTGKREARISNITLVRAFSLSNPITVVSAAKTNFDKDWIACDDTPTSKFYGHCYVEWDVSSSSQIIEMSTSTNGGLVWSAPQTTANRTDGIGGQPLVQPNGTVIVPISNPPFTQLLSFVSTDGGANWSSTVVAAQTPFYTEVAKIRTGFQSAAMDGSGKVYVVWSGA